MKSCLCFFQCILSNIKIYNFLLYVTKYVKVQNTAFDSVKTSRSELEEERQLL